MGTKTYLLEVDEDIWNDWTDSIPRSENLNDVLVELIESDMEDRK
jgi:hypothetical protein